MLIKTAAGSFATGDVHTGLYDIFLTLKSCGWVSVGESNSVVGGMGTTGVITSESDLDNTTAWFVLRSPDYQRQFLIAKHSSGVGYISSSYSRSAGYTGGTASTVPTATDELTINTGTLIGASDYVVGADMAYPYGWYAFFTSNSAVLGMIPLQVIQDSDQDPYIFIPPVASGRDSVVCWHPDNVTQITLAMSSWGKMFPEQFGSIYQGAPLDQDGGFIALPSLWLSPKTSLNIFKGFSTFLRWDGLYTRDNFVKVNNNQFITVGQNIVFPWNS